MENLWANYAALLVDYSLDIQEGERVLIQTTTQAVPLVKEVYKNCLIKGAIPEVDLSFEDKDLLFYENASDLALRTAPVLYKAAMQEFDAYLVIRAPMNAHSLRNISPDKIGYRQHALLPLKELYSTRTGNGSMKRTLCQFPTMSMAKMARMTLVEYTQFVMQACKLNEADPIQSWLKVRREQQLIVDYLNTKSEIRYLAPDTDISFSTKGRTWINSDGRTNMPSGEVFTAPVENSVNGHITFSYPSLYRGTDVKQVQLWVKNGYVERWDATAGKQVLDEIFKIPGARVFGEAAIGTNYGIQRRTRNILFDEKIGGSIHMAIGQSYYHCGGKNQSTVHWDLITDMQNGGQVWADGELIYQDGQFIIPK